MTDWMSKGVLRYAIKIRRTFLFPRREYWLPVGAWFYGNPKGDALPGQEPGKPRLFSVGGALGGSCHPDGGHDPNFVPRLAGFRRGRLVDAFGLLGENFRHRSFCRQ